MAGVAITTALAQRTEAFPNFPQGTFRIFPSNPNSRNSIPLFLPGFLHSRGTARSTAAINVRSDRGSEPRNESRALTDLELPKSPGTRRTRPIKLNWVIIIASSICRLSSSFHRQHSLGSNLLK